MSRCFRGEQFRHAQNVRRAQARPQSERATQTLPVSLIYEPATATPAPPPPEEVKHRTAGPIPRSWAKASSQAIHPRQTAAWRANALALVFARLPANAAHEGSGSVPPLTQLCLRLLLAYYPDPAEFAAELVPWLAPHMRRDIARYAAVHAPLGNTRLYALCAPDGHADGELIVVGPSASVRLDAFRRREGEPQMAADEEDEWDAPRPDAVVPMQSLVILSTTLPSSVMFTLPPTLVNLALIDLPTSVPVHRLPTICPLLSVLDLSYNGWLGISDTGKTLERVEWSRWSRLTMLGMRGCFVDDQFWARVNKGRWQDVDIIL